MTYYHTCRGCSLFGKPCARRDSIATSIKGLGLTSVKHRCAERVPMFRSGQSVLVLTVAFYADDDLDKAPLAWFPGWIIDQTGTTVIAFIAPGTPAFRGADPENTFEPCGSRPGYVKVPLSRIQAHSGGDADITECPSCYARPFLENGGKCAAIGRSTCPRGLDPTPAAQATKPEKIQMPEEWDW